jgi:hypothetical protein
LNYLYFRGAWVAPLGLCCLGSILFLIAATIILALIPVYLANKNVDVDDTRRELIVSIILLKGISLLFVEQESLSAGFASNAVDARANPLVNPTSLSTQVRSFASKFLFVTVLIIAVI